MKMISRKVAKAKKVLTCEICKSKKRKYILTFTFVIKGQKDQRVHFCFSCLLNEMARAMKFCK